MVEMFQYMQSLDATSSFAPPPLLFPAADPTQCYTPVSIKILVLHDIYYLVSHMQSLLYAGTIGGIKQPSRFAQPFAEQVQPPTSLMTFVLETCLRNLL
jgi:hypothetical protein